MFPRRSLPITLAVVMIVLLTLLIAGWVVLTVSALWANPDSTPFYITALSVGTTVLVLLLGGVVTYLVWSIKAINLSRRQSNFIDAVTHELKSPIASLKLYLQTLNRHSVSEEQQDRFYGSMLEDCDRLDRLINQILDAGRLDRKPVDSEIEDVDLGEVAQECIPAICLRYRVEPESVGLKTVPLVVRARRVDIEIILRNLIDNAVKYAGDPPWVEVTLRRLENGCAQVTITDNGRGISPKLRRKIFGRFERLGLELRRDKPGTGLGLYIVRTLVRQIGGRVRVHPREGGPGTMFEVRLPCKPLAD